MKKRKLIIFIFTTFISLLVLGSLAGIIIYSCDYYYCFATEPQPIRWYASHELFIGAIIFHGVFFIFSSIMLIAYLKSKNTFSSSLFILFPLLAFAIYRDIYWIFIDNSNNPNAKTLIILIYSFILISTLTLIVIDFILLKKNNKSKKVEF